jgi:transcriptional regulator of arginine metabolism
MHKNAMTDLKERRQNALADVIRSDIFASQEELAERLGERGFAVTQATISRDLEQIGAVKVRRDGQLAYILPDKLRGGANPQLAAVLRDWVRSVEAAGNLVVLKTPPGSAHLVGVALDSSEFAEIVGTICGDDTIFIACRASQQADALKSKLHGELR